MNDGKKDIKILNGTLKYYYPIQFQFSNTKGFKKIIKMLSASDIVISYEENKNIITTAFALPLIQQTLLIIKDSFKIPDMKKVTINGTSITIWFILILTFFLLSLRYYSKSKLKINIKNSY